MAPPRPVDFSGGDVQTGMMDAATTLRSPLTSDIDRRAAQDYMAVLFLILGCHFKRKKMKNIIAIFVVSVFVFHVLLVIFQLMQIFQNHKKLIYKFRQKINQQTRRQLWNN